MSTEPQESENKANTDDAESTYRVTPRYGIWTDDDKVRLQIALPGVKKEHIKMKALKDYFTLRAVRNEILYTLDLEMGVKIKPEDTHVEYQEGLLNLEFKRYKPLEDAYLVPIE